jgi:hypothetical protein
MRVSGRSWVTSTRSIAAWSVWREILERDLATLKEHVALLQVRIGEIERRLGG